MTRRADEDACRLCVVATGVSRPPRAGIGLGVCEVGVAEMSAPEVRAFNSGAVIGATSPVRVSSTTTIPVQSSSAELRRRRSRRPAFRSGQSGRRARTPDRPSARGPNTRSSAAAVDTSSFVTWSFAHASSQQPRCANETPVTLSTPMTTSRRHLCRPPLPTYTQVRPHQ